MAFSDYMNFINPGAYEQAKTNYGKINARKLRLGLILHAHQCRKAKNANEVSKDIVQNVLVFLSFSDS